PPAAVGDSRRLDYITILEFSDGDVNHATPLQRRRPRTRGRPLQGPRRAHAAPNPRRAPGRREVRVRARRRDGREPGERLQAPQPPVPAPDGEPPQGGPERLLPDRRPDDLRAVRAGVQQSRSGTGGEPQGPGTPAGTRMSAPQPRTGRGGPRS